MNGSATSFYAKRFSHIYVEEGAADYALTKRILSRFSSAQVIPIGHYKDVFNHSGQNFAAQKEATSLILAVNRGELIYPGARFCQSFGHEHFFYCSNLYNCVYDCEYCYLQGMYPSANIVIFVNTEDYFARVRQELALHPLYLCISYDTDLLAMEGLLGLCNAWSELALANPGLTIEIRTKSAADLTALKLPVSQRILYAWTLSPEYVTTHYEHGTPPLSSRLSAASLAVKAGYPVRLCFDPLILYPGFAEDYPTFTDTVFAAIDPTRVVDASLGVFRISASYLKTMRRNRKGAITGYPYCTQNGIATYDDDAVVHLLSTAKKELMRYLPAERIYEAFAD